MVQRRSNVTKPTIPACVSEWLRSGIQVPLQVSAREFESRHTYFCCVVNKAHVTVLTVWSLNLVVHFKP